MGRNGEHNFFLLVLFNLLFLQGTVHADVFTGSAELLEQIGRTNSVTSEGLTSVSKSTIFFQRYNLNYNNLVFPQVVLRAGARLEKQATTSDTDGATSRQNSTVLMPSAGITLANPFVTAGVSYDERDEKVESGGSSLRTFRETNNAFLGLRPEGLPTVDLIYSGQKRYDADRTSIDQEVQLFSLNTMYRPVRSVQLFYNTSYEDNQQHISQSETQVLSQSARAGYGDRFFMDRMSLATNYNISRQDVQFDRAGTAGSVRTQIFPLAGLSAINDQPTIGVLNSTPALIDGNLTASSGMNIGQIPSLAGDIKKRNAGLDFGLPLEVSTLFVWVDRQVPADMANSFVWEIYVSGDNLNWSLHQTIFPAVFGAFDNRFELSFAAVSTRYIMAVTRPLSVALVPPPGVDVSNIFITEVQAFIDRTVSLTAGSTIKTTTNSASLDVNTRVNIIRSERHTLLYDLYYVERTADQTGQPLSRASTLTNAIIANEKFNRVLFGGAKIMSQNDKFSGGGSLTTYDYEASLTASWATFPKLSHIAVLSGKREVVVETAIVKDSGTLSLTNTAEVYPGINAYLGGIENLVTSATHTVIARTDSSVVSFGANIVPHRTMTINLNYDWSEAQQRGNDASIVVTSLAVSRRRSMLASLAYNPLGSLYLFGLIQRIEEKGKAGITASIFSGSWSAQRTGGALELRFNYADNFESETRTRTRNYGPSARWKINAKAFLEVAYTIATIDTPLINQESAASNANFRMTF
jgi:hypothetical protein